MARKRYKPEEIVSLLRQAEVLHGQGLSMVAPVAFSLRGRSSAAGKRPSGNPLHRGGAQRVVNLSSAPRTGSRYGPRKLWPAPATRTNSASRPRCFAAAT